VKTFILFYVLWNGGHGPSGVLSGIRTFNTLSDCQTAIPLMVQSMRSQFPYLPIEYECKEVVFDTSI